MNLLSDTAALADCVLVLTVMEAVGLGLWHWVTGRGLSAAAAARMVLPGLCLMLALRAALSADAWVWVPLALMGALVAHLVDLRWRWRQ